MTDDDKFKKYIEWLNAQIKKTEEVPANSIVKKNHICKNCDGDKFVVTTDEESATSLYTCTWCGRSFIVIEGSEE
jgi:transcription elongation factor Elf1